MRLRTRSKADAYRKMVHTSKCSHVARSSPQRHRSGQRLLRLRVAPAAEEPQGGCAAALAPARDRPRASSKQPAQTNPLQRRAGEHAAPPLQLAQRHAALAPCKPRGRQLNKLRCAPKRTRLPHTVQAAEIARHLRAADAEHLQTRSCAQAADNARHLRSVEEGHLQTR